MKERNIVLTGFMGCGKSLTSRKIAETLEREVFSTDELIERSEGCSIPEIFAKFGEAYFRNKEQETIKAISEKNNIIIDCGGGIVLNADNVKLLKKNGTLFYLSASPETLYQNIKLTGGRPLLEADDPLAKITELLNERKPFYEQADITIDADHKTIDQIAADILKRVNNE